jgi:GcrA cell cycle regulator
VSLNDQLAKLWAAGQTLSEIEQSTGLTRGVAIGHIYRARKAGDPRFQPRPPRSPPPKARKLKPADEVVGNRKPPPPPVPPRSPPEPRVLVDLGWRDCRWATGAAPDGRHLFCGAPQTPGRPYCERHCGAVRSESTSPSASRGSR